MKLVYICSPYRATDAEVLKRNIEYAKELTRAALLRGECPVTPHLYMTQCLNEDIEVERHTGMAAGADILRRCDLVIVGMRYGISEGMAAEIQCAKDCGIPVDYNAIVSMISSAWNAMRVTLTNIFNTKKV